MLLTSKGEVVEWATLKYTSHLWAQGSALNCPSVLAGVLVHLPPQENVVVLEAAAGGKMGEATMEKVGFSSMALRP